jgi:LCP family protein required for cell wall assembly
MISVRDLVKRVEQDSGGTGGMFPSGGIPKVSHSRPAHSGPAPRVSPDASSTGSFSATGTFGSAHREPATEVIPAVKAPLAPDPEPAAPTDPKSPPTRVAPARGRAIRDMDPRLRLLLRGAAATCVGVIVAASALGWNSLRGADNGFTKVAALNPNSTDIADAAAQRGAENYLVVGIDSSSGGSNTAAPESMDTAMPGGADTVMLVTVPADRSRVVTVAFPHDLEVSRPDCANWDPSRDAYTPEISKGQDNQRLDNTYASFGPKCLVNVVQKLTGVQINHFVGIDFAGIPDMVNAVGGVRVCAATPLSDNGVPILASAGAQTIGGKTALNYASAHHVDSETGADSRFRRQEMFVSGLLDAAFSNRMLFWPDKLANFLRAFSDHAIVDNISTGGLLALDRSLEGVSLDAMTFVSAPTAPSADGGIVPLMSGVTALFGAIIGNSALPAATAPPPPAAVAAPRPTTTAAAPPSDQVAVDPSTMTIEIYNGTGRAGVASTVQTKLERYGFNIAGVNTNPDGASDTTIIRYAPNPAAEAEAATLATALPDAQLRPSAGGGGTLEVVLGTDFTGTVKSPTATGNTITQTFTMAPDTTATTPPVAAPVVPPGPPGTLPPGLDQFTATDNRCR